MLFSSSTCSDRRDENVSAPIGPEMEGETSTKNMEAGNLTHVSDRNLLNNAVQGSLQGSCWTDRARPPTGSLHETNTTNIATHGGVLSAAPSAVNPACACMSGSGTVQEIRKIADPRNANGSTVGTGVEYAIPSFPLLRELRKAEEHQSARQRSLHGAKSTEADEAAASANALLNATAAREGLCSSPAEIQADGTLKWNSIYCKHYLFGRCARRRCRFVHGDRETVMQQRRLLEIATAAAAEIAAAFESRTGCSTRTPMQSAITSASETRAHSTNVQDISEQLLPCVGVEGEVASGSTAEVAGTNAFVAGIKVIDMDLALSKKQYVESHQHLGGGVMNMNVTEADAITYHQGQRCGGARPGSCAGRESFWGGSSTMAAVEVEPVDSFRRSEMARKANRGSKTGRNGQAGARHAADKHGVDPRLVTGISGRTRLQAVGSSNHPTRRALSVEEQCKYIDVAGGKNCSPPQRMQLSFLQSQQQRLSRVPSAPCRSQLSQDSYRLTLSRTRAALAVEESRALHLFDSFAGNHHGAGGLFRPQVNGVSSAVSTFLPREYTRGEYAMGRTNSSVHHPQEVSRPQPMISAWNSSSIPPNPAGSIAGDSDVVASHMRCKSGLQLPVSSAGTHNHGATQPALGTCFRSRASQISDMELSRLAFNAVNANDLYALAEGSDAASPDGPSLGFDLDHSAQDSLQRQRVSSTYKLFDFSPQDEKYDAEDSSTGRIKFPVCLSSSGLSGCDKVVAEAGAARLGSVAVIRPSYFPTDRHDNKNREDMPIRRVDPDPFFQGSSVANKFVAARSVRKADQPDITPSSPQKKARWQSGAPDAHSVSKGRSITMTGDIRFVQAAETLSERYGMPFVCAFVPQQGYAIQFLEGVAPCGRSASGLTSACPDSKSLHKAISELIKSVLGSNDYSTSCSTTPADRLLPTMVEKVHRSAFTTLPLNQTPSAPQTASIAHEKPLPLGQSRAAELTALASSGLLWNRPNTIGSEKEVAQQIADAAAQSTDRKGALFESNGVATASLLSVLSSLPELDLVETETMGAGLSRLQEEQRTGLHDQTPASPLNLTNWLERQQSNGQEKRRSSPPEERSFTLLNASAGEKSAVARPQSGNLGELTTTKFPPGSAPAGRATSATCGTQASKTLTNQGGLEVPEKEQHVRILLSQKAVGQRVPIQLRKGDVEVNQTVKQLLTSSPGPNTFRSLEPVYEPDTQQQILWNVWQTLPQNVRASATVGQNVRDNSESNNTSTAYGSFWSRTASGSITSSHHGSAGTSEINLPRKDDSGKTIFRTIPRSRTPTDMISRDLRYITSTSQVEEKKRATVLSLTDQCATYAQQKYSAAPVCNPEPRQRARLRSQSDNRFEGAGVHRLTQSGYSHGRQWKRSATTDALSAV